MDLELRGKTVIVTGGASHIGRSITIAFAAEGCKVVLADLDAEQSEKTAKEAREKSGSQVLVVPTDISNWDAVQAMVKKTLDKFGQIDVLVNNVGWVKHFLFIEKPRDQWLKEININFLGMLHTNRAVLDNMIQRRYGKIVNIASDSGRMGEYYETVYAGCKAGVIASSKSIAREVGRYNINVNCVCPGATPNYNVETVGKYAMSWDRLHGLEGEIPTPDSEKTKKMESKYALRRLGAPEDIAYAALFLASERSRHMTGQTLSVSGGYTMV